MTAVALAGVQAWEFLHCDWEEVISVSLSVLSLLLVVVLTRHIKLLVFWLLSHYPMFVLSWDECLSILLELSRKGYTVVVFFLQYLILHVLLSWCQYLLCHHIALNVLSILLYRFLLFLLPNELLLFICVQELWENLLIITYLIRCSSIRLLHPIWDSLPSQRRLGWVGFKLRRLHGEGLELLWV